MIKCMCPICWEVGIVENYDTGMYQCKYCGYGGTIKGEKENEKSR